MAASHEVRTLLRGGVLGKGVNNNVDAILTVVKWRGDLCRVNGHFDGVGGQG